MASMEGPMTKPMDTRNVDFAYREHKLEFERVTDATGYWFAAAVLFAFLAAGIIVYRAGNAEFRTAANDTPAVAQATPVDPPPILTPR
jgi:hypothetical protein